MRIVFTIELLTVVLFASLSGADAGELPADLPATRTSDVIYGKKIGVALTMDVFQPKENANGAAVIFVVSGGWVSDNQALNNVMVSQFVVQPVKRGYTVFAVYHG